MIDAELYDLLQELWLRKRNEGLIAWTTDDDEVIPIKDLDDEHLLNIIDKLLKAKNKKAEEKEDEDEWIEDIIDLSSIEDSLI